MRILLATLTVATLAACASSGGRGVGDQNLLTRADIESTDQANAYDIVRTLRPRWLQTRGPSSFRLQEPVRVYIDGTRMGGPRALETVPRISIEEIRYYSATEAQARWGLNHTNGAIEVITRRG